MLPHVRMKEAGESLDRRCFECERESSPPRAESGAARGLLGEGREVFTELGQPCGQERPALEAGPSGRWGRGLIGAEPAERSRRGGAGVLGTRPSRPWVRL